MSAGARSEGARVLVTGGAGFVGSHVVDVLLARGAAVSVLARATSSRRFLDESRVRIAEGDIADASERGYARLVDALRGCDTLYHVAGVVTSADRSAYERVNVEGSARAARAAADAGVRRILLVSSQAAAGPSRTAAPRTEVDPEEPMTAYGRSKLGGERVAREIAAERGLELVIVRPPAVYGPRDRAFLRLFRLIARGIVPLHASARQQLVSIVHAADLARAIVLAAERAPSGATYFVTDGTPHRGIELAQAIATALGKRPLYVALPQVILRCAAWGSEVVERMTGNAAMLTRERLLQWTAPYWTISDERARRELGYAHEHELFPGMADTAAWYRKAGWL
jgi:nucleoside-diphosphate-sugar epimerase